MTPAATLLAAYDPEDIKPGWIALAIVVALAIATFLLWRSMNSQLRRIDVPTRAELASRADAEHQSEQPGPDAGSDVSGADGADDQADPGPPAEDPDR
jgi:hypothetical protein